MYFCFKQGEIELFTWDKTEKSLYKLFSSKIDEHDSELTSIDILYGYNLLISSCYDGFVKIWNIKKELLREIKFSEPIISATFINSDADILIGH
jgi:WD40 repeat protein